MSVVGVASTTRNSMPSSINVRSLSTAAPKNDSPGMNITTNSGVWWNCCQYALAPRLFMCARSWRAWSARSDCRSSSDWACKASR